MRWHPRNAARRHWSLASLVALGVLMASPAQASFTFTLSQAIHHGPADEPFIKNYCAITNTGPTSSSFNVVRSAVQIPSGWTTSICIGGVNGTCLSPETNSTTRTIGSGQTDSLSIYFTPNYLDENPPYDLIPVEGSGYATMTVDEVGLNAVSHTLGAVTDGCDVLLVDDDEGGSIQSFFESAISGRIVGTWRRRPNPSSPASETQGKLESTVSTFPVMVWATGAGTNTLNADDRAAIDSYLAAGGRLLLSGQDIAFDLCDPASANDSPASKAWFESLFKSTYTSNASGSTALNPVAGEPIADGLTLAVSGGDGASNQTDPDVVTAGAGAHHLWTYGTGGHAAVRVTNAGLYRAVYLGFGFEAISTAANRNTVMTRTLDWLTQAPVGVFDPRPRLAGVALEAPSPNPSFAETAIGFSLIRPGPVSLRILDLAGRVVRTLENGSLAEGRHVARWNGRADDGRQVASGLYLAELRSGQGIATRKLVRSR
jgi:flagellar hook capping protein FlgD